jgi:citrate synthase
MTSRQDGLPFTRIGTSTADTARLRMRGRDTLTDVVGRMSFAEAFYLIVTGREASERERRVMDAALIILMDHGITPTAMVSRLIRDSLPDQPQVAVAAGVRMVGDKFAGTMAGAGAYLMEGIGQPDTREWAKALVARFRASRRRLPGFGHPHYALTDPRAERLFEIAKAAGCEGRFIELIGHVNAALDEAQGKHVVLNVTGALGAILCEIGFPVAAMRGVAVVGRAGGLVAHVLEEEHAPVTPALRDLACEIPYRESTSRGADHDS